MLKNTNYNKIFIVYKGILIIIIFVGKYNFRNYSTLPLDHLNPGLRSVMSSPGGGKLAPGEKSYLFRGGNGKSTLVLIGGLILRGPQNGPD